MKPLRRWMVAAVLPALMAAQAAVAGVDSGASGDADRMCQQLRATGATDIAKATLLLRSKLSRVPVDAAAAFDRANAAGVPDAKAGVGNPLYHVWLAGRHLDRATR